MKCTSKMLVENLVVYNNISYGIYRGITRVHFPKWAGWGLLDIGKSMEEVDEEVVKFYEAYFYYNLKLDLLVNPAIACAVLNFATMHGKKKALQKLQKVVEEEIQGIELIEAFNDIGKCAEYHLLLEFMEFYSFTGEISKVDWLTKAYRCL